MLEDSDNLHKLAMALLDKADVFKREGKTTEALGCMRESFELERKVALSLLHEYEYEPSRSILFRSAASIGLEIGEIKEAEKLIHMGLIGNPPSWVEEELKDLYEDINLNRHYLFDNSGLSDNEFVITFTGDAVGHGICDFSEFEPRISNFTKILWRTAQRKLYPDASLIGKIPTDIKKRCKPFIEQSEAASYRIKFRIGAEDEQLEILEKIPKIEIISEAIENIELFEEGKYDEVRKIIKKEDFYNNFIKLSNLLLPDGTKIRSVGFHLPAERREKPVILKRIKEKILLTGENESNGDLFLDEYSKGDTVTYKGILKYADKTKSAIIKVVNSHGEIIVKVNDSIMDDIVRPLWDKEVIVRGQKRSKTMIDLEDIQEVD
jgi:tetratricopeptide (TPR) repeat protein